MNSAPETFDASDIDLHDAELTYREFVMTTFPRDMRIGLNLALYRTFAVPRIAELLVRTGHIHATPLKRSVDTGLYMYELFAAGFDSRTGRDVVRALNKMHHRWAIEADDYLYVLTAFMVVPKRWIDQYGPKPITPAELHASVRFYRELGARMAIHNLPRTYRDAETIFDSYEADHVAYSDAGHQLMEATQEVMALQLPRPLKPFGRLLTRLILDDYVARAVGLAPAPGVGQAAMRAITRLRRAVTRWRPETDRASWFVPGDPVTDVYPHGYTVDLLGPESPTAPPSRGGTSR